MAGGNRSSQKVCPGGLKRLNQLFWFVPVSFSREVFLLVLPLSSILCVAVTFAFPDSRDLNCGVRICQFEFIYPST
jgi:hypothetical protein